MLISKDLFVLIAYEIKIIQVVQVYHKNDSLSNNMYLDFILSRKQIIS